jgi:hypothetical protein
MPPSPRLSARRTKATYLKETMKLTDQKISEVTPMMLSGLGGTL